MTDQLLPVPFYEDTNVLVDHDGKPFVAMKPIVENMGLAWQSQHVKLTEKFSSVVTIIVTTGIDGKQYEMLCLPLRKIPAFLYSINPNKVSPELREKIIRYQSECDDALWDYWTKGVASRPGTPTNETQFISLNRMATYLLKQLKLETDPESRRYIHAQLTTVSLKIGLQAPDIEKIGRSEKTDHESPLLEEFWEIFDTLQELSKGTLNHARNESLVAINMPQLRAAAFTAKMTMPENSELRRVLKLGRSPNFIGIRTVNSQHTNGSMKCWLFDAEAK